MMIFTSFLIGFILLVFIGMAAIDFKSLTGPLRKENSKNKAFAPKALVIIPCKGVDLGLYYNLLSIKNQSYRNFDAVAVVDKNNDSAVKAIKKAGIKPMVSSSSCSKCSGKVRAISTAIEKLDYPVYVIADSDINVKRDWLRTIISPLSDKRVGLSTMYPYFNHVGGFWSRVKSVWGMVGEGLMKSEATVFGWGGSLAFRKGLLDRESLKFFKDSKYSVSDDICLTLIARRKGLKIRYTGSSQPVVNQDDDMARFWEWSNRQTKFSIIGNRKNLYSGVAFYAAEAILILSGISFSVMLSPLFLFLLLHWVKSAAITYWRSKQKDPLSIPISLLMPFIYFANLLVANSMTSVRWRRVRYALPKA